MTCRCGATREQGYYCGECGQAFWPWSPLLAWGENALQVAWFSVLRALGCRTWRWNRPGIWLPALKPDETAHVEGEGWRVTRH